MAIVLGDGTSSGSKNKIKISYFHIKLPLGGEIRRDRVSLLGSALVFFPLEPLFLY